METREEGGVFRGDGPWEGGGLLRGGLGAEEAGPRSPASKTQTRIYNGRRALCLRWSDVAFLRQHSSPGITCQSEGRAHIRAHQERRRELLCGRLCACRLAGEPSGSDLINVSV